ncbi:CHRD domain-containing protein [Erythrobacter alti]|uniref:CHRD domain-containing protein n=1 Tax=Erythrobacter alti TaxID=1896145 RepID=UPI0030F480C3
MKPGVSRALAAVMGLGFGLLGAGTPASAQESQFVGVAMFAESVTGGNGEDGALGDFDSEFDLSGGRICYYLDIDGIRNPNGLAIHEGDEGRNGPLVVQLQLPVEPGDETCVNVERAVMDRLLANRDDFYIIVTAIGKPDGAIRGQLGH